MKFLVIPTNRIVESAVISAIMEISVAKKYTDDEIALLILDNSTVDIRNENINFLKKYRSNFNDTKVIYIDLENQVDIVKKISSITGLNYDELIELLILDDVDYGKVANMIYITVALLGGDTFFRRDSDCSVKGIDEKLYPIINEIKYLGKDLENIKDTLVNPGAIDLFGNEEILIVGSDYFGEFGLDIKELITNNKNSVDELARLIGVPDKFIDYYIDLCYSTKRAEKNVLIYHIKEASPKDSKEIVRIPDCGNIAIKEIFKWLPNFIGSRGMGYDFNSMIIGPFCRVPMIYHPNKIQHFHDTGRKDIEEQKPYWIGLLKLTNVWLFSQKYNDIISEKVKLLKNTSSLDIVKQLSIEIPEILEKGHALFKKDQPEICRRFIYNVLLESKSDKYKEIGEYLFGIQDKIIADINNDYEKSIKLYKMWPSIMKALINLSNNEKLINSYRI